MEKILETIISNPIYVWIAIILSILLVFGLVKKIFKLLIIVVAGFILYVSYIYYFTDGSSKLLNEAIDNVKEIDTKKIIKDIDSALEDAQKKVEETLDKVKKNNNN